MTDMPAGLAYAFIYHQCVTGLDDDSRLEVDAILGDRQAAAVVQENRRASVALMDADIG